MIVYRFEKNGIGPWSFRPKTDRLWDLYQKFRASLHRETRVRHPGPYIGYDIENLLKKEGYQELDLFFGCPSLEELNVWFNYEERVLLRKIGFKLKTYECPEHLVFKMDTQVAFVKKASKVVKLAVA